MRGKEIPRLYPDRTKEIEKIADKILSSLKEYDISALDFLEIIEFTQKEGLRRFRR